MSKEKIAYKTLSKSELAEFLDEAGRKVIYKKIGHTFRNKKNLSKQICSGCGLMRLNNNFTRWAIDKGCLSEYHPGYSAARKRYSTIKF